MTGASMGFFAATTFVVLMAAFSGQACRSGYEEISIVELRDKIRGGWAGQMIGVSYGAPTEFRFRGRIIPEDRLPEWNDERIKNSIHQDDLYVEMTFAKVLDVQGLDATTEDFATMFRDSKYRLWHANLAARRALRRGAAGTESGTPRFNAHANDIDFQIESDFIGLMSPGLPQASNDLCHRAGRVMNSGDGILGGAFVSGMYAAAFFESDPRKVVESGYRCLPPESPYGQLIGDVLRWSADSPDDWIAVWHKIEDTWGAQDPCPAGALLPFNIDAKLNGAYIALGLLFGNSDFDETLLISTRAGQDSDCNPSNACGILGVMHGYDGIAEKWKQGIPDVEEQKFDYTDYSFNTIVESTVSRALALVLRNGGRTEGGMVWVKRQEPVPLLLELWDDHGAAVERIANGDQRWKWQGPWETTETASARDPSSPGTRRARAKDAEASVTFRGTGAILVGPFLPTGGTADVYLDGARVQTIDVYPDDDRPKRREALWHVFGLENHDHNLRIVVRGEPFGDSAGTDIAIVDLVVFE